MDMTPRGIDLRTLDAPPAVRAIRRIEDGFKNYQALRAGYGSGLFDWLERHGPAEKSAIAGALMLRGAHLGAFLQTLEDLGLLKRENSAYTLAPGMRDILCVSSAWCQAAAVDSLTAQPNGWSDLCGFLSEGWMATSGNRQTALTLHPFLGEARHLADTLAARWTGKAEARELLCIDGADGLLAAALCQRLPHLRATVVVMPEALLRAESVLAECGVSARCRLLAGTPLDPPAGAFDHAVLFHSLYPVRKSTIDALTAVSASLTFGGELCTAHWFCLEACETAPGGLRDLDKAVLTDSHPLCHVEQFCQRLEEAGLTDTERGELTGEYGNTKLHFGRRADRR